MSPAIKALYSSLAAGALTLVVLTPVATPQNTKGKDKQSTDAVENAQTPNAATGARPEQQKTEHDRSNIFNSNQADPASDVFKAQPNEGKVTGFDFYRDPLNAPAPKTNPGDIQAKETANRPNIMARQKELLERRYNLQPRLDPQAKMSRGKPLPVGPTARLAQGMAWERIAQMSPADIRASSRTLRYRIRCRLTEARSSPRCKPTCSRACNVSMSNSICQTHSSPSFHPRSS